MPVAALVHWSLGLTKVNRYVVADGAYHEVACAVLADGKTSPVLDLLAELKGGIHEGSLVEGSADESGARDYARLIAQIEYLAHEGEPSHSFDYLTGGIWEFKIGDLRVTFYDTPGDGTFTPKTGIRNEGHWRQRRYEFPDEFDDYVRLGHRFTKVGQKTPKSDLDQAAKVREEDLKHDRDHE